MNIESPQLFSPLITGNLPLLHRSFIGRQQEIDAISKLLLEQSVQLLTLIGLGGVGKTALALEVARRTFPLNQMAYVSLEDVDDVERVLGALIMRLKIKETGASLKDVLVAALKSVPFLLIIDNFEQVKDAAFHLVELLEVCQSLKILVTSREKLNVSIEEAYRVYPLEVTEFKPEIPLEDIQNNPSVALFLQEAHGSLQLTQENVEAVVQICRQLEGLPLGLKIAAAQLTFLTPQELLEIYQEQWIEISNQSQGMARRHWNLSDTIDSSYRRLSAEAQALFRRLALFNGAFTRKAVIALSNHFNIDFQNVYSSLKALTGTFLLERLSSSVSESYYRMLEPIREYARKRLKESQETEQVYQAYVNYYLRVTHNLESELMEKTWYQSSTWVEQEYENLVTTFQWLLKHDQREQALLLGAKLDWFWYVRGLWSDGRDQLEQSVNPNKGTITLGQAKAHRTLGRLLHMLGDYQQAQKYLEESIEIFHVLKEDEQQEGLLLAHLYLADMLNESGKIDQAITHMQKGLNAARDLYSSSWHYRYALVIGAIVTLFAGNLRLASQYATECLNLSSPRERDDEQGIAWAESIRGYIDIINEDYQRAKPKFERALKLFQQRDEQRGIINTLWPLAKVAVARNDYSLAYRYYRRLAQECILRSRTGTKQWESAICLRGLGELALEQNDLPFAIKCWGAAAKYDAVVAPIVKATYDRAVEIARKRERKFTQYWDQGQQMDLKDFFVKKFPLELSEFEIKILQLLCEHMTSDEIRKTLHKKKSTIDQCISRMYEKCNIPERTRRALINWGKGTSCSVDIFLG